MYSAQETKNRIKKLCKASNLNEEKLLTDCQLGVNAIRQINDKKGMSSYSLARIADRLDCSVDYLLGRTNFSDATDIKKPPALVEMLNRLSPEDYNRIQLLAQLSPEELRRILDFAQGLLAARES